MDTNILYDYLNFITAGMCFCIGYSLKEAFPEFPNRYIPLTLMLVGIAINITISSSCSSEVVLSGMISGLSSTGFYEVKRSIKNNDEE